MVELALFFGTGVQGSIHDLFKNGIVIAATEHHGNARQFLDDTTWYAWVQDGPPSVTAHYFVHDNMLPWKSFVHGVTSQPTSQETEIEIHTVRVPCAKRGNSINTTCTGPFKSVGQNT